MSNKFDQIVFGILFTIAVGFQIQEQAIESFFWRNLCGAAIVVIYFTKNSGRIDTEYVLTNIESGGFSLRSFYVFLENVSKLFIATVAVSTIVIYFLSDYPMSFVRFVNYGLVSGMTVIAFVALNLLIAKRWFRRFTNGALVLLIFVPSVALILASTYLNIFELGIILPGNMNFGLINPWFLIYWPLPMIYFGIQYAVVKRSEVINE